MREGTVPARLMPADELDWLGAGRGGANRAPGRRRDGAAGDPVLGVGLEERVGEQLRALSGRVS